MVVSPAQINFTDFFDECCLGDKDAVAFCRTFRLWVKVVDNVIDKDQPIPEPEALVRLALDVVMTFSLNEFFQTHKQSLLPVIVTSVQAFKDSIPMEQSEDPRVKAAGEVVKSEYQSVYYLIAYLCGGQAHMDAITKKFRHYQNA